MYCIMRFMRIELAGPYIKQCLCNRRRLLMWLQSILKGEKKRRLLNVYINGIATIILLRLFVKISCWTLELQTKKCLKNKCVI